GRGPAGGPDVYYPSRGRYPVRWHHRIRHGRRRRYDRREWGDRHPGKPDRDGSAGDPDPGQRIPYTCYGKPVVEMPAVGFAGPGFGTKLAANPDGEQYGI